MKPLLYILLYVLSFSQVFSQNFPEDTLQRFTLSAATVGLEKIPDIYWMDIEFDSMGNPKVHYRLLDVGRGNRGSEVEIPIPQNNIVHLFSRAKTETESPQWEPLLTIPIDEGREKLLIILYQTQEGKRGVYYLNDSLNAHPPRTLRVLNLSQANLVVSAGGEPSMIPPRTLESLGRPPMDSQNRFLFSYGVVTPKGPWQSPRKAIRFRRDNQRLLVVYTLMPTFVDAGGGEKSIRTLRPTDYMMFDLVQLPEAEPGS